MKKEGMENTLVPRMRQKVATTEFVSSLIFCKIVCSDDTELCTGYLVIFIQIQNLAQTLNVVYFCFCHQERAPT